MQALIIEVKQQIKKERKHKHTINSITTGMWVCKHACMDVVYEHAGMKVCVSKWVGNCIVPSGLVWSGVLMLFQKKEIGTSLKFSDIY